MMILSKRKLLLVYPRRDEVLLTMKFRAKFQLPSLNLSQFKKKLDLQLRDLLARSAAEWLMAAEQKIPVWSGAAVSTLQELASKIGFQISVTPTSTAPDRRDLGRRSGEGELQIDMVRGVYGFTYNTTLDHLIENETMTSTLPGLITPTPYKFREDALRAWRRVAATAELPNLKFTLRGRTYR
jgi:hypothetical protein